MSNIDGYLRAASPTLQVDDLFSYVRIVYIPAITLNSEPRNITQTQDKWHIKIESPKTALPGSYQAMPGEFIAQLSTLGEPLTLRLLVSELYIPHGIYKVTYHKNGKPLFNSSEQLWRIPVCRGLLTTSVESGPTLTDDLGHLNIGAVVSVSVSGGAFSYDGTGLTWQSGKPPEGANYSITYRPALSLKDIVYVP